MLLLRLDLTMTGTGHEAIMSAGFGSVLTGNRVLLIPLIGFLLKAIRDRAGRIQDYCPISIFPSVSCFWQGKMAAFT